MNYVHVSTAADHKRRFKDADGRPQFEGTGMYDKATGYRMGLPQRPIEFCRPMLWADIPPHVGPSGKIVNSRSDQRDEFKRSDTRIYEPDNKTPRGFTNEKYAHKRGHRINVDARDHLNEQRARATKRQEEHAKTMSMLANSRPAPQ